jgi:hypothetical protein
VFGKPVVVAALTGPHPKPIISSWARRGTIAAMARRLSIRPGAGHELAKTRPTLQSPTPRFDLLKLNRYLFPGVQFARGCPFLCEFCDIIELFGRVPRLKTPDCRRPCSVRPGPSRTSRRGRRQLHRQQARS